MYRPDPMISNYLISLDMLFDTRLGTVAKLGKEAMDALEASDYDEREDDSFLHSLPGYTEAWDKRDVETLFNSVKTEFLDTAVALIREDVQDYIVSMPDRKFVLYLNTHPYQLTQEQKDEYCLVMNTLLAGRCEVKTRSISPELMTPHYLRSNCYTAVAMYDFIHWIKMHYEALYEFPMNELVVVVPKLKEMGIVAPEVTGEFSELKERYTPHEALEIALMEVLAVKHYPISDFTGLLYKLIKRQKTEG